MAVRQINHKTRKYVWDTADTKPTAASHGCQVGDTGYDRQTGIMYITYDGTNWVEKDTVVRLETSPTIDIGDVTLLAGTASIGKLGANSGVDIGNVTLNAGTNLIGKVSIDQATANANKVGHNVTGIGHGVETCDSAGTDQSIVTSSTPAKKVIIQAQTDNTSAVAVGGTGVDATVATGTGVLLYAGDWTPWIEVDDLADVFFDALVTNEGVRFIYLT